MCDEGEEQNDEGMVLTAADMLSIRDQFEDISSQHASLRDSYRILQRQHSRMQDDSDRQKQEGQQAMDELAESRSMYNVSQQQLVDTTTRLSESIDEMY